MKYILSLENICIKYFFETPSLFTVSFKIPKGKMSVIVGPNGSGKSSVLKAIIGEIDFTGKIKINDEDIARKSVKIISYVSQKKDFDVNFPINTKDFVSMGIFSKKSFFFINK